MLLYARSEESLTKLTPHAHKRTDRTLGQSHLSRGLRALELLADGPANAAALGRELRVNRSTALRLLRELEGHGYVKRDEDRRYAVVPERLLSLISDAGDHPSWVELVNPRLEAIRDHFHESTNFSVPAHGTMVYMSFFPSSHSVTVRERAGAVRPMYCSAIGKAYLSAVDEDVLDRELSRMVFEGGTENAAQSPGELRARLVEVRDRRYAVDREETAIGVSCVAVPVAVGDAIVGAAGVSVPTSRMPDTVVRTVGEALVEAFAVPMPA